MALLCWKAKRDGSIRVVAEDVFGGYRHEDDGTKCHHEIHDQILPRDPNEPCVVNQYGLCITHATKHGEAK